MSLNADDDNGPEPEPDYNEEEIAPDPSSGENCTHDKLILKENIEI